MELNSSSEKQMLFWNFIQYIGIVLYPVFAMLICLIYTHTIKTLSKSTFYIVFAIPLLTFLIRLTNPLHHIYYKSVHLTTSFGLTLMSLEKGPWYIFYGFYLLFNLSLATFFYIKTYSKVTPSEKSSYKIIITSSLVPHVGLGLILLSSTNLGIDYVALFLPVSLFLLLFALFKYDFLELKTLARDILFDKSTDAMLLLDSSNRLIDHNYAAKLLFDKLNPSLYGQSIEVILKDEIDFLNILNSNPKKDLKIASSNGYEYFEVRTVTLENNHKTQVGQLISLMNITNRRRAQEELKIRATIDALTGLYNRGQFMKLAKFEIEQSKHPSANFSLLMLDVDDFKNINDSNGHAAGDAVLKHLGKHMSQCFRKSDIIGRIGGEEFAVLLMHTSAEEAYKISENLRMILLKHPALYEDTSIHFTFSAGISSYNTSNKSFDAFLKLADEAMYQSKNSGRNKTTIKNPLPITF
jgi:diguanylate cyclase (GGDEF)-like protein